MMSEYLISHGKSGGFGRFSSDSPLELKRGDNVIVGSRRGVEFGVVLCPATDSHKHYLADTHVGRLLRRATDADEQQTQRTQLRAARLFERARTQVRERQLPVEVLDVEVLFEGEQAVLQVLALEECQLDGFLTTLEIEAGVAITIEDLALSRLPAEKEEQGGCGEPGCGRASGGGCTSCASGGGCSSCGSGSADMRDYFAHLRGQMEQHNQRTPLSAFTNYAQQ